MMVQEEERRPEEIVEATMMKNEADNDEQAGSQSRIPASTSVASPLRIIFIIYIIKKKSSLKTTKLILLALVNFFLPTINLIPHKVSPDR